MEHHVYSLSGTQAKRGHEVVVLQPHRDAPYVDRGVRVMTVGRPIRGALDRLRFGTQASQAFLRLHAEQPFDVLHAHGDVIEGACLALAARRAGIPMVLTVHAALSRRPRHRALVRLLAHRIPTLIAVSPEIKRDLVTLGCRDQQVRVISSGVDLAQFRERPQARRQIRSNHGLSDHDVLALFVGGLEPMKGPDVLLDAARSLNGPLRFFLVGEGPLDAGLRRAADQLPSVTFIGALDRSAVGEYLAAADLFVLPSVDLPGKGEGTPTALIEALASGLPAIVSDAGGGKHLVARGPCGVVVPQADPAALAEALRTVASDSDQRHLLAGRARDAVADKDWAHVAEVVEDAYAAVPS